MRRDVDTHQLSACVFNEHENVEQSEPRGHSNEVDLTYLIPSEALFYSQCPFFFDDWEYTRQHYDIAV